MFITYLQSWLSIQAWLAFKLYARRQSCAHLFFLHGQAYALVLGVFPMVVHWHFFMHRVRERERELSSVVIWGHWIRIKTRQSTPANAWPLNPPFPAAPERKTVQPQNRVSQDSIWAIIRVCLTTVPITTRKLLKVQVISPRKI